MDDPRNNSKPIAAKKTGAARRDRCHVRTAVATKVTLQARVNSDAKGEVPAIRNQDRNATPKATIPTRPTMRNVAASRIVV